MAAMLFEKESRAAEMARLSHDHAGPNAVGVRVVMTGTGLEAEVAGRGRGFNPKKTRLHPPGTGLILMESYAGIANLHLRIDSTRRRGTIIKIQTI